jgi:glycosyltransferase involved in cell wall biosynthesis
LTNNYKKKTKILIWYWGRLGGGQTYSYHIIKYLKKLSNKNKNLEIYLSVSKNSELYGDFNKFNLKSFNIKTYNNWFQLFISLFYIFKIKNNFLKFIKTNQIDVVYSPMYHIWNFLISKDFSQNNVKYLFTIHDAKLHPGENSLVSRLIYNFSIKTANAYLTLTKTVKSELLKKKFFANKKIFITRFGNIENIKNINNIQKPLERNKTKFLFFGRILEYKGINNLLIAFSKFNKDCPNSTLHIVGRGDVSKYSKLILENKNIYLVNNWISEKSFSNFFKTFNVCVLPYIEASQSGVIPLMFALRIPVIITPVGGLIEQVKNNYNGIICKDFSCNSLQNEMKRISMDNKLYNKLVRGAMFSSKDKTIWKKSAEQIFLLSKII